MDYSYNECKSNRAGYEFIDHGLTSNALQNCEDFATRILESSINGIYIYDLKTGSNKYINPQYTKLTGHTLESLNAMSDQEFFALFHPDDQHKIALHMQEVIEARDGDILETEYRFKTADGRWIWCLSWDTVFQRDSDNNVSQFMGTFLDVTERKRTEKALQESEAKWRSLAENIPDLVMTVERDGTISFINRSVEGLPVDEVIGRSVQDLMTPEDIEKAMNAIETVFRTGESAAYEIRGMETNSETRFYSTRIGPIIRDKKVVTAVQIATDITEQRQIEVQQRYAQKLESIGGLAAGIAHEINTPIQFVGDNTLFLKDAFTDIESLFQVQEKLVKAAKAANISAEIIEEYETAAEAAAIDYLREEVVMAVEQSLDGVHRIATIVQAMKAFSHQGTQHFTDCDINKAIEDTAVIARNEWKYIAEMKMELDPTLPVIQGIQGELSQTVLNLIVNATQAIAEACASGDRKAKPDKKGTITIRTSCDGDRVRISITDTGTGIPKAIQNRIFEPFFTTRGIGQGTGQGLAIAYNIIIKHGGSIDLESEVGKGSSFHICLPV